VLPEEYEESADKAGPEEFEKVIMGLIDLVFEHPKVGKKLKKSASKLMDKDMLDIWAADVGLGICPDEAYSALKPDKKMYMVKLDTWKNNMLSQFKKKKAPSEKIAGTICKKMEECLKKMKDDMKSNLERKAAEEARLKVINEFFDTVLTGDTSKIDECIKANAFLLNEPHPQKGNATALIFATRNKALGGVKHLIELKCDVNKQDNFNWTAMNWANEEEDDEKMKEVIKALTDAGCEANDDDEDDDDSDDDFNLAQAVAETIS